GLKNVRFTGYIPDQEKVALYDLCAGVVLPSHLRSEAFGVSLVEGAMFARPLVCAEAGSGTSFVNIHGETGLVVPPENPEALREAMTGITQNKTLAAAMGANARMRYENLLSGEAMGKAYGDVYEKLLGYC
ncbi:MAG: glycosyltransferase, partial [Gammaproteobacteria bacterium]|nr:glycosyltransferase [Gammaproteobacteria bacterium]